MWNNTIKQKRSAGLAAETLMGRGQFDFRASDDNICFFKCMDVKCVHLASNFYSTESATVQMTQKCGTRAEFACP